MSYVFAHFHTIVLVELDTGDKHKKFMCWFLRGLTGICQFLRTDRSNLSDIWCYSTAIRSIHHVYFSNYFSPSKFKVIGNPFLLRWGLLPVVMWLYWLYYVHCRRNHHALQTKLCILVHLYRGQQEVVDTIRQVLHRVTPTHQFPYSTYSQSHLSFSTWHILV